MKTKKITAIEKFNGENSLYYKVGDVVSEIKETTKVVELIDGCIHKEIVVYQIIYNSKIICEIPANVDVVIYY